MVVGMMVERHRRCTRPARRCAVFPGSISTIPVQRSSVAFVLSFVVIFALLSAVGSYKAYEFTDSVNFCGQFATPSCIRSSWLIWRRRTRGLPVSIATWARAQVGMCSSKLSGMRQVYYTLRGTYPRPIPSPVANSPPGAADLRAVSLAAQVLGRATENLHPLRS